MNEGELRLYSKLRLYYAKDHRHRLLLLLFLFSDSETDSVYVCIFGSTKNHQLAGGVMGNSFRFGSVRCCRHDVCGFYALRASRTNYNIVLVQMNFSQCSYKNGQENSNVLGFLFPYFF